MLTFTEYQRATNETAVYPEHGLGTSTALAYVILGLCGEAGELANKTKKILRDHEGVVTDEARAALLYELGDALWYAARLAAELRVDDDDALEAAAETNLTKLRARKDRGTIHGSGDTR